MRRIRAFVAANLPLALLQRVADLQAELRGRAQRGGVRVAWVPAPNMHVTLKFLAQIPEESVWAVRDVLSARLAGRAAIPLAVQRTGGFPTAERARVLWVGIDDSTGQLVRLARDVDEWLAELGFEPEGRAYRPHLTIGRVKAGETGRLLEGREAVELGEAAIDEVVLYESVLQRAGAEYRPLFRVPLDTAGLRTAAAARRLREEQSVAPPTENAGEGSGRREEEKSGSDVEIEPGANVGPGSGLGSGSGLGTGT